MCGIFGYVGHKKNAAQTVLEGLKFLEYRGYDSWGISVKTGKKLRVEKHVGKIGDAKTSLPESSVGIGHTRWATHGGVIEKNAHPHLDCSGEIAVLHNGIVENFQALKTELIKKGHLFISDTDTEIIAHFIEEFRKENGFATSVRLAFNKLKGLNAILVVNAVSSEIIAAKNGSPLVIGIGVDEYFVASDVAGIVPHTKSVYFVRDNEMVILGRKLQVLSLPEGKKIIPSVEIIDWKIDDVTKGDFKDFMIKEIYDQPLVIRNIAENYTQQIEELAEVIKAAKGTFLIGAGTAFHACIMGMYLFSKIAKKHINTAAASEFNYLEDFLNDKSLVIALSQSGETIDIVEPLTRAKQKGTKIVGLVNGLGSTIYRMSDYKMLLGAGPEKAVASTKAYVAKLSILFMLSYAMAGKIGEAKGILLAAASEIENILQNKQSQIKTLAKKLSNSEHIYIIGRGMSFPGALEGALKIKEVSYIHTEGLAGGELKHGPIALITKGTPCIVLAPHDETYDAILSNAIEIKSRGGFMIGLSSEYTPVFDEMIKVANGSTAAIISQSVPLQLLAYYLALEKNLDPDKPRNLAKSVTVK